MKKPFVLLAIGCAALSRADLGVVPNAYENTPGTSTFLYTTTSARTYQFIINDNQLTDFIGENLNGLSFRLPTSATVTWPPVDASFASFDIFIGPSVAPASTSSASGTAGNYTSSPTQVRSGSLNIVAGSYTFGGSPNAFGPMITFNDYLYTGGHLGIEMRHTGLLGTTQTRSFDALPTSTTGYGTDFAARFISNGTGAGTLSTGNFMVVQLSSSPVPEPATMAAVGLGLLAIAARGRRRR
jgi:hypothetical protein